MNNDRIQFLIDNLREDLNVEVKNWLNGLSDKNDKAHLAKEIIALANQGGGYIFVGFEDENGSNYHKEIAPSSTQSEAFTQDNISDLVNRYVTPQIQCTVYMHSRTDSTLLHPVIIVPGNHRTPVWAKRGGPEDGSANLKSSTVYIRGTGAQSRPPENQDEWEKLIERLVKARQNEMLSSIRDIIDPPKIDKEPEVQLVDWSNRCTKAWRAKLSEFPKDSPYRFTAGYWSVSFRIEPFSVLSLSELNENLERNMPKCSGSPPFTYIHREPLSPKPYETGVEAWIVDPENHFSGDGDFWRVDRQGFGFLLRPFEEDENNYRSGSHQQTEKPCFDWLLPSYRMVEIIKFIEALAKIYSDESAKIELMVQYVGMQNRSLQCHDHRYVLSRHPKHCNIDNLENTVSFDLGKIETNIEEIILALLSPIYEQFSFTKLPQNVVAKMVKEALSVR